MHRPVLPKFEDLMIFSFSKGRIFARTNNQTRLIGFACSRTSEQNLARICPGLDLIPDWIVRRVQVVRINVEYVITNDCKSTHRLITWKSKSQVISPWCTLMVQIFACIKFSAQEKKFWHLLIFSLQRQVSILSVLMFAEFSFTFFHFFLKVKVSYL